MKKTIVDRAQFEIDIEEILQYILASENDDFDEQVKERGFKDCKDHIYAKALKSLKVLHKIKFIVVDE